MSDFIKDWSDVIKGLPMHGRTEMSENEIKPVLTIHPNTLEMAKVETRRAERLATRPYSKLRVEMGEVALYDQSAIDRLTAERDAALAQLAECRADAERLDWLEQFVRKAYFYGASFDFAKAFAGEGGGYRFMTRARLDSRQPTLRKAIDAARSEAE